MSSGSVGKPKDGDPRAGWVELLIGRKEEVIEGAPFDAGLAPASASETWIGVVYHRVGYDVEAVAAAMVDAGLPETLAQALRES